MGKAKKLQNSQNKEEELGNPLFDGLLEE